MQLRREAIGLSQAELAEAIGADVEEIRRYESGEAIPSLAQAGVLAWALDVAVIDLAHPDRRRTGLSGAWWLCWQTFPGGTEVIESHPVKLDQRGEEVIIHGARSGIPAFGIPDATWRGTLYLWEKQALTGWYLVEGAVRNRGTIYLDFDDDDHWTGRWVGRDADGEIASGLGALARDEQASVQLMDRLRNTAVRASA